MVSKEIIKTTNIIKAAPDDTLNMTLSHLTSSHDAAFVFNDKGAFLGVVNPYYCLIHSSFPGTTKIEHCLFHPPRIIINDSLERVSQMMIESKIHYLPVFDAKNNFLGIMTARRVLNQISGLPFGKISLGEVIAHKKRPLVTLYDYDTISQAVHLFKEHKISKLVVIDKNMKLHGVLTYYDLIPYLVAPGVRNNRSIRAGEKEQFNKMKVKNYSKPTVIALQENAKVSEAINLILTRSIGSVVVVDHESHPIGIVTTRDIMQLIQKGKLPKKIGLSTKHIETQYKKLETDLAAFVQSHIAKDRKVRSARVRFDVEKNGGLFKIAVFFEPERGEVRVFEREGKDPIKLVKEIKQAIRNE